MLVEKYFDADKKLLWVLEKEQNAKNRFDEKAVIRWSQLKNLFYEYPEKFERMFFKLLNEVKT